jgi:hypothetical protein
MVLGKQASCLRIVGSRNPDPKIAALEEELRELGNSIGSVDEIALIRDTINHSGPVFIASLSIQIRRAGVRCLFRRTPCRLFRRAGECRLRPPKPPEIPGSLDRDVLRSLADREASSRAFSATSHSFHSGWSGAGVSHPIGHWPPG